MMLVDHVNPLPHSVIYKGRLTEISILKQERDHLKISYESADDGWLSQVTSQKSTQNGTHEGKG